jgi:glycyl-tRNA synthetase beta chain
LLALDAQPAGKRDEATLAELVEFVMERMRALLLGADISAEMFESVRAMRIDQPLDFRRRLEAVRSFTANPAAPNLAAANKRIRNILKQAGDASGEVDPARFTLDAERALFARLVELEAQNAATDEYGARLVNLAALREPVDAFFDGVMVNDPDAAVRANRLSLLARLDRLCRSVADLSCLPG